LYLIIFTWQEKSKCPCYLIPLPKAGNFHSLRVQENYIPDINALGAEGCKLIDAIPLNETLGRTAALEKFK